MNFLAEDITIIDYQNINEGFRFETSCNYEGATTHGEIVFNKLSFESEATTLDKLKSGSFINSSSPANFTIKNSAFKMHHRSMENFDVFKFEDSGLWTPDDDSVQYITFTNNSVTFNDIQEGVFNNFYLSYIGANKRYKAISVTNNTFFNMVGSVRVFLEIKYYSVGSVYVANNNIYNCSSETDMFVLHANELILAENNKFDSILARSKGLLTTSNAQNVTINNLEVTNIQHNSSAAADPLIKIVTKELGHCTIDGAVMHSNYIKAPMIDFDEFVGSLTFKNSRVYNEVLQSFNNYIVSICYSQFRELSSIR